MFYLTGHPQGKKLLFANGIFNSHCKDSVTGPDSLCCTITYVTCRYFKLSFTVYTYQLMPVNYALHIRVFPEKLVNEISQNLFLSGARTKCD